MAAIQTTQHNLSGKGGSSPQPLSLPAAALPQVEIRSTWWQAWRRFSRNPLALIGAAVVLFWFWLAIGADSLSPYPYNQFDFNAMDQGPSVTHFLGTDTLGRDLFTLII